MYKSSNNLNVVTEQFSNIEEFEDFLNCPFRRVVEILKYNPLNVYAGDNVATILGIEVTMIIDNNLLD